MDADKASVGDDGTKEYEWRVNRPAQSKEETPAERKLSSILKDCFRIYFPTRETVAKSRGGLGVSTLNLCYCLPKLCEIGPLFLRNSNP
jgi:hypothetical protein